MNNMAELARAIVGGGTEPHASEHLATVLRRDQDGTYWVRIPGGADETPITTPMVEAADGDTVRVSISGGRSVMTGNVTSPVATGRTVEGVSQVATASKQTADDALNSASVASEAAEMAVSSAASAASAAVTANTAANSALAQLGTVEDVLGTVNWITEHGTYSLTQDTVVDDSKVYYTRSGSGTSQDPYVYTAVAEPTTAGLPTYYELSIDAALSQYVSSHLALTNDGLYVLKDNSGYKALLSNTGMTVYNPSGDTVAQFGEFTRVGRLDSSYVNIRGENLSMMYAGMSLFDVTSDQGASVKVEEIDTFSVQAGQIVGKYLTSPIIWIAPTGYSDWESIDHWDSITAPRVHLNPGERVDVFAVVNGKYELLPSGVTTKFYYDTVDVPDWMGYRKIKNADDSVIDIERAIFKPGFPRYGPTFVNVNAQSYTSDLTVAVCKITPIPTATVTIGKYSDVDEDDSYSLVVGNGTADDARSNALTVDWDGNVESAGDVTATDSNDVAHNLTEKVNRSGDTMTGALSVDGEVTATDAYDVLHNLTEKANQTDVDTALAGKVSKSGDTMTGALTVAGDVTATDANGGAHSLAVIGDRVYKSQTSAVSMANSTYKNVLSISIDPGTWIITGGAEFAANATGIRQAVISTVSAAYDGDNFRAGGMRVNAYATYDTFINLARTIVVTVTTTIYLVGWQNSGGALNTYGMLSAVRIK
jgi:hypothetical protein